MQQTRHDLQHQPGASDTEVGHLLESHLDTQVRPWFELAAILLHCQLLLPGWTFPELLLSSITARDREVQPKYFLTLSHFEILQQGLI